MDDKYIFILVHIILLYYLPEDKSNYEVHEKKQSIVMSWYQYGSVSLYGYLFCQLDDGFSLDGLGSMPKVWNKMLSTCI